MINRLYQTITGTLAETIGSYQARQAYSAMDAGPWLWVYVAFVESMLTAYRRFVGPISDADCESYWQGSCQYARRLGLIDAVLPSSYAAMRNYLDRDIATQGVIVSAWGTHDCPDNSLSPCTLASQSGVDIDWCDCWPPDNCQRPSVRDMGYAGRGATRWALAWPAGSAGCSCQASWDMPQGLPSRNGELAEQ